MVSLAIKKCGALLLAVWLVVMVYLLISDVFWPGAAPHTEKAALKLANAELHPRHNFRAAQNMPPQQAGLTGERHGGEEMTEAAAVHVCLCSDADGVLGAVAAINSVWTNTRHRVVFHLLVTPEARDALGPWLNQSSLRAVDYEMRVFDETRVAELITAHGGREELTKPMNYARYFYADMFSELHGKAIHLDADVIVQGDVWELQHTQIEPGHVMAVSEDCKGMSKRFTQMENTLNKFINFHHASVKAAKLNPVACSFNAGVYVFHVDKWRAENITEQLMGWVTLNAKENIYGNERGGGGSSPPMMIVMQQRYSPLDPMWHVRHLGHSASSKIYSRHMIAHAKLLHWNGHFKPWRGVAQQQKLWDKYFVPDPSHKLHPVRKIAVV